MNDFNIENFPKNGFVSLGSFLDKTKCSELIQAVARTRKFDENLFLKQEEFLANPVMKGVNPTAGGFNLAEKMDLSFIEEHPVFIEAMTKTLGSNYEILLKKFVMGTPESIMPEWLLKHTEGQMVANLGPYVKAEYRDMTYFHGIDWHQDIIDYPNHVSDFITLYVYLGDTTKDTSPLYVVPKSHLLGAATFPHKIEKVSDDTLNYTNDLGDTMQLNFSMLLGEAGSVNFWHSATLHGTQPHINSLPRISIRYLIQRQSNLLEMANRALKGFHSLTNTRHDLDKNGEHLVKGNQINTVN